MTLRHRIGAALRSPERVKAAADTVITPAPGQSVRVSVGVERGSQPLASMAAHSSPGQDPAGAAHAIQRMIGRAGIPQEPVSPLTQLPEADPAILASVLRHARSQRDPMDYLRLLSHDSDVNSMARTAALPALLLTDALVSPGAEGAPTRETIIDILKNLQLPAMAPARAYPPRYPR